MSKKKKGYVLLLAMVVAFFISLTSLTSLIVVGRYVVSTEKRQAALQETIYVERSEP